MSLLRPPVPNLGTLRPAGKVTPCGPMLGRLHRTSPKRSLRPGVPHAMFSLHLDHVTALFQLPSTVLAETKWQTGWSCCKTGAQLTARRMRIAHSHPAVGVSLHSLAAALLRPTSCRNDATGSGSAAATFTKLPPCSTVTHLMAGVTTRKPPSTQGALRNPKASSALAVYEVGRRQTYPLRSMP